MKLHFNAYSATKALLRWYKELVMQILKTFQQNIKLFWPLYKYFLLTTYL